ncbi:ATP synthase F1 subunit epsilon [Sulfurimonas sp. HSL-1656]|uniref:ATP synthase F1 subunit epsilon n=1 Tax=Thiomicrolovo subterrani TaxID=3131934 RepID=UPI0031F87A6A
MDTFKLEVITPNGLIFDNEAVEVTLPGEEGEFGVLPRHASLTTLLKAGVIDIVTTDKRTESIVVNWGVVQVTEDKVTVLVDGAVAIRGEGESEVAKVLEDAKKLLSDVSDSKMALASVSAKIESAAHKLL